MKMNNGPHGLGGEAKEVAHAFYYLDGMYQFDRNRSGYEVFSGPL
jgi:hypothetical protein